MENKNFFANKFFSTLFLILVILGASYFYFYWTNRFPDLENPKEVTFKWEYKNKNFSIKETYYESVDKYYSRKEKGIITGLEERSIEKYLSFPKEDQTINELTADLEKLGQDQGFTKDEIVDFTLAFVQSIPYDNNRAKTDLTHPRYPYEVLYENLGICSDKSLLADALVREEGYGVAIFLFSKEEHMALGIECPQNYSSYNSGYCFAETTATGNRIGLIPELQANSQASALEKLPAFTENQSQSRQQLSTPIIMVKMKGFSYNGVVETIKLVNQINSLKAEIASDNKQILSDEEKLKNLETQLDGYKSIEDYATYNNNVPVYNNLLQKIKDEITAYNQKVNLYNNLIVQY